MLFHTNVPKVQSAACEALWCLTVSQGNSILLCLQPFNPCAESNKRVVIDKGGIECILLAMETHRTNVPLQKYGFIILAEIATQGNHYIPKLLTDRFFREVHGK